MSELFFTSDNHFNHRNIIKYASRPFADVDEMNETMIANWNQVVTAQDEVYVLGDFAYSVNSLPKPSNIFHRLNGKKHLIVGNHDEQNPIVLTLPWSSVADLRHVRWGKSRFALCHYPLETWHHSYKGTIMLHGHCHGTLDRRIPHRYDVGVDSDYGDWWPKFTPINVETIVAVAATEKFEPTDHHGRRNGA